MITDKDNPCFLFDGMKLVVVDDEVSKKMGLTTEEVQTIVESVGYTLLALMERKQVYVAAQSKENH